MPSFDMNKRDSIIDYFLDDIHGYNALSKRSMRKTRLGSTTCAEALRLTKKLFRARSVTARKAHMQKKAQRMWPLTFNLRGQSSARNNKKIDP